MESIASGAREKVKVRRVRATSSSSDEVII